MDAAAGARFWADCASAGKNPASANKAAKSFRAPDAFMTDTLSRVQKMRKQQNPDHKAGVLKLSKQKSNQP
jgi:hypothetical protein